MSASSRSWIIIRDYSTVCWRVIAATIITVLPLPIRGDTIFPVLQWWSVEPEHHGNITAGCDRMCSCHKCATLNFDFYPDTSNTASAWHGQRYNRSGCTLAFWLGTHPECRTVKLEWMYRNRLCICRITPLVCTIESILIMKIKDSNHWVTSVSEKKA